MADQAAPVAEDTPLLAGSSRPTTKPQRTVTFNPNPVSKTFSPEPPYQRPRPARTPSASSVTALSISPGALGALNNRLRRRNSLSGIPSGSGSTLPLAATGNAGASKIGPQRSTKNAQKLKLLPTPDLEPEEEADEESARDVYSQYTRIKDPTARRDALRLGKADRNRLPRVTAYCTANRYQMDNLLHFLKGRGKSRGANPKLIDECIYTPYSYASRKVQATRLDRFGQVQSTPERRHSTGDLIDLVHSAQGHNGVSAGEENLDEVASLSSFGDDHQEDDMAAEVADFDIQVHTPEVFLFDYGVVVIWGMTAAQEQRFLKEIAKFEVEKLAPDDVETELFNFYYTNEYQARIYNDFIALRDKHNYMTKLAISHALAQSVKTSLFEELIAETIESCKDIPAQLALTGKINLSRAQINMQIGDLFILRISIHLNGSVLDTPELFWVEPQLEPVYQAVRSYLEMDQRVGLLTERLDVIADLLEVLKEQLSHGHGEKLEWIVIILIAAEILVALVNIAVDLAVGI